jgi:predicted CXXCH cytochrome family protein
VKHPKIILTALSLSLWALVSGGYASAADQCLDCHGSDDLSTAFANGATLSLFVDRHQLEGSVHATLDCQDCHTSFTGDDHPTQVFPDRSAHSQFWSRVCESCHSEFQGIHRTLLEQEGRRVVCTDCHTAHAVQPVAVAFHDTLYCIGCHGQPLHLATRDGSRISLQMNPADLANSVHQRLSCRDCHFGFTAKEHPERSFRSPRDHTLASAETCRRCHFDKYTRTLESIHYELLSSGRQDAPVCVDCHGAHAIATGRLEKVVNARRCAQCHEDIYVVYKESVHGAAMLSEHNEDVPVCSDCHRAHDIPDPTTAEFHLTIPEICGNCHSNSRIAGKYGLSTQVVESYVQDFHGVTLRFYKKEGDLRPIATCTDCHGIHDIAKITAPGSPAVKANLVKRCQKCHPDATANFPDSWVSHYEASFDKAPGVFLVNLAYKIFIPFMVIGLGLQILLHIWRYAINR